MIGLAKACSGGGTLFNYILDEEKGYELDRNLLSGSTPKEMFDEMKMIQDFNQRATNKTFSMVLSPHVADGKNLSNDDLKKLTQDYLNKLGIDTQKQQYVVFVHTEKQHKHVHIIANRVKPDGKLISDHHIGKQAQWIAHSIAKENGLISAKQVMFDKLNEIDSSKVLNNSIRNLIYNSHQEIIKTNPQTFSKYIDAMHKKGYEVYPVINKQKEIQGFRILHKMSKTDFKMSEVNRSMSAAGLMKSGLKNDLNNQYNSTLNKISKINEKSLEKSFEKNIITLKYGLKPLSKSIGKPKIGMPNLSSIIKVKQKLTKENIKQFLEENKFLDDVIIPNIIIKEQEHWNKMPNIEQEKSQLLTKSDDSLKGINSKKDQER